MVGEKVEGEEAVAKPETVTRKETYNFLQLTKNKAWEEKNKNGAKAYFDDALWYMMEDAV